MSLPVFAVQIGAGCAPLCGTGARRLTKLRAAGEREGARPASNGIFASPPAMPSPPGEGLWGGTGRAGAKSKSSRCVTSGNTASASLRSASSPRGEGLCAHDRAAGFGLWRAGRVGDCRSDKTPVRILVYITHIPIRHILAVERGRDIAVCFEKLYLSTVIIRLCQRKTRAIRQKPHCSPVPDMVKYPRKTGETSDLAES